ncbi:MAG TPA: hypothetical protein VFL91_10605, partial [Thermomicrobiales bacterium]|nr:hypothetical protein [Thermomicrobiales bacterium]
MNGVIRPARPGDAPALADLAALCRRRHQEYQPRFWREAADARARHLPHLARLVADPACIALVHEDGDTVDGFVIAMLRPAPPVYDPGGPTCLIDDFAVADDARWATVGAGLLEAAARAAPSGSWSSARTSTARSAPCSPRPASPSPLNGTSGRRESVSAWERGSVRGIVR